MVEHLTTVFKHVEKTSYGLLTPQNRPKVLKASYFNAKWDLKQTEANLECDSIVVLRNAHPISFTVTAAVHDKRGAAAEHSPHHPLHRPQPQQQLRGRAVSVEFSFFPENTCPALWPLGAALGFNCARLFYNDKPAITLQNVYVNLNTIGYDRIFQLSLVGIWLELEGIFYSKSRRSTK